MTDKLETVGVQHLRAVDGQWHYGEAEYANQEERELVTRSQAEAIIAAKDADNAALTARIAELNKLNALVVRQREEANTYGDEGHTRAEALETQLAAARKALEATHEAISEYYRYQTGGEMRGSYDGKPERNALWKSMYQARAALEDRP